MNLEHLISRMLQIKYDLDAIVVIAKKLPKKDYSYILDHVVNIRDNYCIPMGFRSIKFNENSLAAFQSWVQINQQELNWKLNQ